MCVFEAISRRLNVQNQRMGLIGRGQGGLGLSAAEVSAMLAGLPTPVQALVLAKVTGDRASMSYLKSALMAEVGDLARKREWKVGNAAGRLDRLGELVRLERLAELVRDDLALDRVRSGSEAVNRVAGRYWPDARRIEFLGLDKASWIRTWRFRYADLLRIGQDWEAQARVHLGREYFGR
jgi:hypothetical protein